ncbi:MAG: ERF family protein [Flexilinea sp.]|nr:ERF family protein [Flexilinea sp.]
METNNGLIYRQISAIMKDCPAIGKNSFNQQQKFAYRSIDDVMNALQNILPKYGVFYVPEVIESTREERQTKSGGNLIYSVLKVKYTFYAEDGSHVSAVVQSEGMDSADKSSNKAMSAACKYALFQVFNIPTVEFVDPDETTPEPTVPQQVQQAPKLNVMPNQKPSEEEILRRFKLPDDFHTILTLADAEMMMDSEGEAYGNKSISNLFDILNLLSARLKRNHLTDRERQELKDKVDAICLIFDQQKKQRGL